MNEKIKDFLEQAYTYSFQENRGQFVLNDFAEKLIELTVKESAKYINERTLDWDANLRWVFNDGSGYMEVDVNDLLNIHFGVELE